LGLVSVSAANETAVGDFTDALRREISGSCRDYPKRAKITLADNCNGLTLPLAIG